MPEGRSVPRRRGLVVRGASLATAAVGATVLAGWSAGPPILTRLIPGLPPMVPLTAAGFVGLGVALWLAEPAGRGGRRRRVAVTLAMIVSALGCTILAEYATGRSTGLDTLLLGHAVRSVQAKLPGRPYLGTAVAFLMEGLAVAFVGSARRRRYSPAAILAPGAALLASVALLGYIYGVTYLRAASDFTGMAVPTAITFVIFSVGVMMARPDRAPMSAFTSPGPGGVLARRLIPALVLLPYLIGLLGVAGRDAVATNTATWLVTASTGGSIALLAFAVTTTVSVLNKSDRALQSEQEQNRVMIAAATDPFISLDQRGVITAWNQSAETVFGWTASEAIGREAADTIILPQLRDAHSESLSGLITGGSPDSLGTRVERQLLHRDGRELPIEIAFWRAGSGPGLRFHAFMHDITERLGFQADRERYAHQLEHAQRLESLGDLVGGIAHDYNNLLNVITGYTDLVAEDATRLAGDDTRVEPLLADVEQVRSAALRAATLTRQLLVFGRRDVVRPEVLDVGSVISGAGQLLRRALGEHIDLVITAAPGGWTVLADAGQIDQVLVSLANNARDAMPGGGKLTIDTRNVLADEAYVSSRPGLKPGRYVRLAVSDTGTGMTTEVLDRAFEPFYGTKAKDQGAGLGLTTVYGIVTRAGGYAQIHSDPGLGTTVTMLLPATDAAAVARPVTVLPGLLSARAGGETVLLVEDEPSLWNLAHRILTRGGYKVCGGATPADAIRQATDLEQPIDLLLTDVIMPEMMGNEVAARIRAVRPNLPVLYMSGYAQPVLHAQGVLDTGVDLMEKPYSASTMLTRVQLAIDRGKPGDLRRSDRPSSLRHPA
jgi:PAS domain S-box-containing protein